MYLICICVVILLPTIKLMIDSEAVEGHADIFLFFSTGTVLHGVFLLDGILLCGIRSNAPFPRAENPCKRYAPLYIGTRSAKSSILSSRNINPYVPGFLSLRWLRPVVCFFWDYYHFNSKDYYQ